MQLERFLGLFHGSLGAAEVVVGGKRQRNGGREKGGLIYPSSSEIFKSHREARGIVSC